MKQLKDGKLGIVRHLILSCLEDSFPVNSTARLFKTAPFWVMTFLTFFAFFDENGVL